MSATDAQRAVWDASDSLGSVVAALRARVGPVHPAHRALRSTAGAVEHAEPELALDDLCQIIRYFDLRITLAEYGTMQALAEELAMTDLLEDARLLSFIIS
ncbi:MULTISPECIES: hypothetical protein [unclassified Streptomyces]|uniref:hypothetical protein n=1 Tax=unclassified Streptomyces TaxID=2593676 RepID=UPI001661618A|nr:MULTISPECIES: hypothetical protein [unclassified Streptomyces]MBD0710410.1 hypothetical protein [Streptomyces sp. CBMA291]MBD0712745.1 hypothetical protein [Streptomyces sp. CBMA370]